MQRKIFQFLGGGPLICAKFENLWKFSKYFDIFQGKKWFFSKVAQNDARSLKKLGSIFPYQRGGGGLDPGMYFYILFFFSYFVSFPNHIQLNNKNEKEKKKILFLSLSIYFLLFSKNKRSFTNIGIFFVFWNIISWSWTS